MKIIILILAMLNFAFSEPPSGNQVGRNYLPPQQQQQQLYGPPGYTPGEPIGLPSNQCPPNNPEANKELVKKYYQELFGDHNLANLDNYVHQDYIQHLPLVADGAEAFRQALMGPLGQGPKTRIEFRHLSAVDDLVWSHLPLTLLGINYAVMDIFRFECGKVKEHWDVLQDTDLSKMPSANPHPFF